MNLPNIIENAVAKAVDNKSIFGAVLSAGRGDVRHTAAAGNLDADSLYFIASTTKIYVTAIIMRLREQGVLSLDDPIGAFLPDEIMEGLHVYKGKICSRELTIRHLLAHTSGLPDYFQGKKSNGKSLLQELSTGIDQHWTFEEAIALSKRMRPHFAPGAKGKAHYSDTNYQLLGRIIEITVGKTLQEACREFIFDPLGLQSTYLYSDSRDDRPAAIYFKDKPMPVPQAMSSFQADGGIVSTAGESLAFLEAFFAGRLFPKAYLEEMCVWNRVMFPLEYGVGLMRFKLSRLFSPLRPMPELLGHSGLSGAFAFFCPDKDLYLAGTVNQLSRPDTSFRLMLGVAGQIG